jgi:predicted nucleic-acid-binding Zn-ribbon protein
MRKSLKCPKCSGGKVLSFLDGLIIEPLQLTRKRRQLQRIEESPVAAAQARQEIANLEARYSYRVYLCDGCGYSERYVNVAEIVVDEELRERLNLRLETPPSGGTYR